MYYRHCMNHTRTKIIGTIGPASHGIKTLRALHDAGMNVARINMSHADHKSALQVIERIKKINSDLNSVHGPIGVLVDTQGPEIRTGDTNIAMDLKVGDEVTLTVRDEVDVETSSIMINYKGLIESVHEGSKISIDNGLINFKVISKDKDQLLCKVLDGGKLGSKRHVNLPGVRVNLPSITSKDIKDIDFAIKHKADFIALSFVREASDVEQLREILKAQNSSIKIIAKIENQEGLDNIHQISQCADMIMVARGDLGIETNLADLPNIQRRIMYASAKWGARSIVATHLLESMIDNPSPTRAEVTDVANAIYEGADAIMLSGETSVGKYPIQCVQMLKEISERTEEYKTLGYEQHLFAETDWQNIAIAAKNLAEGIQADGIIAITRSGRTANVIANTKPTNLPVFCFTNNKATYQQLSIMGSMHGFYIKNLANQSLALKKIQSTIKKLVKSEKREYKFILISGIYSEQYTDSIQVIKF